MDRKHSGAHSELIAAIWLLKQGYEVFRNISQHGAVDIVAMKDGQITLFDVKKVQFRKDGSPSSIALEAEQIRLGVKLLCVFPDDNCEIRWNPKVSCGEVGSCRECGKEFRIMKGNQKLCSKRCRTIVSNRINREIALAAKSTIQNSIEG